MDAAKIIKAINRHSAGSELFLVGGFVRDYLLKRGTNDMDFTVSLGARQFAMKMSRVLNGAFVLLDEENGIYRVVIKPESPEKYFNLDFSNIRKNSIEKDLSLRDFTINAMAVRCGDCGESGPLFGIREIIDPFGGISDLKKRAIRRVSDRIFIDDPLRMLRAYRLKAELGFNIEPGIGKLARKYRRLIKLSAAERIRDEILKILSGDNSAEIIVALDSQKLLEIIIPEISIMKRSARRFYYHREGLWQHSKESLLALEHILSNLEKYAGEDAGPVRTHLAGKMAVLKLTALLHDTGKPYTARVIDGRTRFFGHEKKGETLIEKIFKRLRMSNKEIQTGSKLVLNHMRPANLGQVERPTERAIYRYFRDIGDESIDLLLLSLADISSYLPPFASRRRGKAKHRNIKKHRKFVRHMIGKYLEYSRKSSEKKIIDGNIIMRKFSLTPGPLIGKILGMVRENQFLGCVRAS